MLHTSTLAIQYLLALSYELGSQEWPIWPFLRSHARMGRDFTGLLTARLGVQNGLHQRTRSEGRVRHTCWFCKSLTAATVGEEVGIPRFPAASSVSILQLLGVLIRLPDPWIAAFGGGGGGGPPVESDGQSPDGRLCILLGVPPVAQPRT